MNDNERKEKPEVYAIRQDGGDWRISRRDFLKTAGIGAAAVSAGLSGGFIHQAFAEESLESVCSNALAHDTTIGKIFLSGDGKYLVSYDGNWGSRSLKCWDMANYVLMGTKKLTNNAQNIDVYASGFISGKSCVLYTLNNEKVFTIELPNLGRSSGKEFKISGMKSEKVCAAAIGRNENVFVAVESGKIFCVFKGDGKKAYKDTQTAAVTGKVTAMTAFDGDSKLFLQFAEGDCGVLTVADGSFEKFDVPAVIDHAVVPGDAAVLLLLGGEEGANECRALSLPGGKQLWEQTSTRTFRKVSVTPDGSMTVLMITDGIALWKTADGSSIHSESFAFDFDGDLEPSGDGTTLAVSAGKSLLFFNLPDLRLIGCPVDLKTMKDNTKGIRVRGTDAVTGKEITYTLPCGASIPDGAVCTCNCVAGAVCACNSYKSCSCNSHRTSYSSSYWYPN